MCYYSNKNSPWLLLQPLKVEILDLEGSLTMFHDILIDSESELIKELSAENVLKSYLEIFFTSARI